MQCHLNDPKDRPQPVRSGADLQRYGIGAASVSHGAWQHRLTIGPVELFGQFAGLNAFAFEHHSGVGKLIGLLRVGVGVLLGCQDQSQIVKIIKMGQRAVLRLERQARARWNVQSCHEHQLFLALVCFRVIVAGDNLPIYPEKTKARNKPSGQTHLKNLLEWVFMLRRCDRKS
jgi:hypothetical protein